VSVAAANVGDHAAIYTTGSTAEEAQTKLIGALGKLKLEEVREASPFRQVHNPPCLVIYLANAASSATSLVCQLLLRHRELVVSVA